MGDIQKAINETLGPLVLQRSMNIAYSLFMGMVDERVIYC
jgi:hypothetical protein